MDLSTVVVAVKKRAKSDLFSLSRAEIAISRKSASRSFSLFFNFFISREQTLVFKSVKEYWYRTKGASVGSSSVFTVGPRSSKEIAH